MSDEIKIPDGVELPEGALPETATLAEVEDDGDITAHPGVNREVQVEPAGPQIDPTGDLMKDMTPERLLQEVNGAKKERWLAIFLQLARSSRFIQFVERNFVIQDRIDEAKKQISTVVYENPRVVGPSLSKTQVAKIFTLLKTYSTRHPEKVLKDILATLGQPDAAPSIIASASEDDVKVAASQSELKGALD